MAQTFQSKLVFKKKLTIDFNLLDLFESFLHVKVSLKTINEKLAVRASDTEA